MSWQWCSDDKQQSWEIWCGMGWEREKMDKNKLKSLLSWHCEDFFDAVKKIQTLMMKIFETNLK